MSQNQLRVEHNLFVSLITRGKYTIRRLVVAEDGKKSTVLSPSQLVETSIPQTLLQSQSNDTSQETLLLSAMFAMDISDAYCSVGSDVFIDCDSVCVPCYDEGEQLDDSLVVYNTEQSVLVRQCRKLRIDDAVVIHSRLPTNWFHWMIEALPQVIVAESSGIPFRKVVVDRSVRDSPNHIEILRRVISDHSVELEFVDAMTSVYGERSFAVFGIHRNPFNIRNGFPKSDSVGYRPGILTAIREKMLASVNSSIPSYKRIFLLRDQGTRNYNQQEVFKYFETIGFTGVYCEKLSLDEQVSLFSKAVIIVGPTGAAWTNLLFVSAQTKCYCWAPSSLKTYSCFSALASQFDINMAYYFYDDDATSMGQLYRKSYTVNALELFERFIETFQDEEQDRIC